MQVVLDGVSRSFGGSQALAGVDLEIGPGITGLLGPNGAGKTTFLRILATVLAPSHGSVKVGSWNPARPADRTQVRRQLGYLPQDLGLYPRFTVFEFVDYMAILKELTDPGDRHRRVQAALTAVGLQDRAKARIRTLSGGMKRRVGIAQAIVADPGLLLLDEPTTGLDPEQRIRFRQLIAGLGEHRTVLLSTHLVEDVAAICAMVIVLWEGRVLFHGTPQQLRSQADGMVWHAPEPSTGSLACWRTDSGDYKIIGPRPSAAAVPAEPSVEDGYLLVTSAPTATAVSW